MRGVFTGKADALGGRMDSRKLHLLLSWVVAYKPFGFADRDFKTELLAEGIELLSVATNALASECACQKIQSDRRVRLFFCPKHSSPKM